MDNVSVLADGDFQEKVLNFQGVLIVKFWAEWCGPCKAVTPVLTKILGQYQGKVHLATVNVDDCHEITNQNQIMGVPVTQIWKDGVFIDQITGITPNFEADLRNKIDKCLE